MTREGQVYPQSHSYRQAPDLLTPGELEPALPPLSARAPAPAANESKSTQFTDMCIPRSQGPSLQA